MKRFLYIVAISAAKDEPLAFRHSFVDAEDEKEAYDRGFIATQIPKSFGRVNDYVVEIPRTRQEAVGYLIEDSIALTIKDLKSNRAYDTTDEHSVKASVARMVARDRLSF